MSVGLQLSTVGGIVLQYCWYSF